MCAPKDKRGSLGTAVKSECLLYSERQNISCYTPHPQRSIRLVRFLGLFRLFWLTENQEASATEKNSVWYLKRTQWETGMRNWGDRAGQSTKNIELYSFWEATCTLLVPDKCGINKPRISCIVCLEVHYNLYQNTPREKTLIFRTVWYYPDSAQRWHKEHKADVALEAEMAATHEVFSHYLFSHCHQQMLNPVATESNTVPTRWHNSSRRPSSNLVADCLHPIPSVLESYIITTVDIFEIWVCLWGLQI